MRALQGEMRLGDLMIVNSQKKQHITILDWMRGFAAVLVCSSHLRNAMIVDWGNALDHGLINKFLYGITGFGHQSVVVFFVLSGYLVGGSVIAAGPKFRWTTYLIARLSRLWVVLVPCLVITFVADAFTVSFASDVLTGDYATRWHSAPVAGKYSMSWQTLVGNLAFVQTIFVPVYGSNGPLWSLANEFWYYVMFPLVMNFVGKVGVVSRVSKLVSLVLFLTIFYWASIGVITGFLVWIFGALVSYLNNRMRQPMAWRRSISVVSLVAFATALGLSKWSGVPAWFTPWSDLVLGVAVAAFLLCALQWDSIGPSHAQQSGASKWFSDISFSLYLSHFPLVMLVSAYLFHDASLQPGLRTWIKFFCILGGLFLIARIVWCLFERHTPIVKKFVASWFNAIYIAHR
ncbi:acyltransferase [uncultured Sphaerotilus sp.]|uniref:acyltransferase family protein n=1 Tax=uncultured Sphaerotilus sp. TaxID=474984 RepID=UPI0030CA1D0B